MPSGHCDSLREVDRAGMARRRQMWNYIYACWKEGWVPTYRDLSRFTGCCPAVIHRHMHRLVREGWLEIREKNVRLLRFCEMEE